MISTMNPKRIISVAMASAALAGCASQKAERAPDTLEERYAASSPSRPDPDPDRRPVRRRLVPALPGLSARGAQIVERADGESRTVRAVFPQPVRGMRPNFLEAVLAEDERALLRHESKPTETIVRQALASEFPGAKMLIVTTPRTNAYGPYGLAVGVLSSGERCAYAWQWAEAGRWQAGGAASLRGRICGRDQSFDQMAQSLDGLELRPIAAAAPPKPRARAPLKAHARAPSRSPQAAAPKIARDAPQYIVPINAVSAMSPTPPRSASSDLAPPETRPAVSLPPEALQGPSRSIAPRRSIGGKFTPGDPA